MAATAVAEEFQSTQRGLLVRRQSELYVNDSESPFTASSDADTRKPADGQLLDSGQPTPPLTAAHDAADNVFATKGYVHPTPA